MNKESEYDQDTTLVKRWVYWSMGVLFCIILVTAVLSRVVKTVDTGILRYEEYTEIYQTCVRINTDLCTLQEVPASDAQFAQFSKAAQTLTLKKQLNRWVEEYNAKSRMVNRSFWKSDQLPYQLSIQQFSCN